MSALFDAAKLIGRFRVIPAAGGGTEYPALSFRESVKTIGGGEQVTQGSYRETEWEIESFAEAANTLVVGQLQEAIRDELNKIGLAVELTQLNTPAPRTLPAASATLATGSMPGWPRVDVDFHAEDSVAHLQFFRIKATTRQATAFAVGPAGFPSGVPVIAHDAPHTETRIDENGTTVRTTGTLRVAAGFNARLVAITAVETPLRAAAVDAGKTFLARYTQGPDLALTEYEFVSAPPSGSSFAGSGFGAIFPGLVRGERSETTRFTREGRAQWTISGFGEGSGNAATQFALAQLPGASALMLSRDISEPVEPSGRVNFRFEMLVGVEDVPEFEGLTVYAYRETIEKVSGGRQVEAALYDGASPRLRRGPEAPHVYRQRTSIDCTPQGVAVELTPLMDPDRLARPPVISESVEAGLRTVNAEFDFIFEEDQGTLPAPRSVVVELTA